MDPEPPPSGNASGTAVFKSHPAPQGVIEQAISSTAGGWLSIDLIILDKHCVRCHRPDDAQGGVDLTGSPAGEFTTSYNALAPRVPFSEWKGTPQANFEPLTHPDRFGARASPLMTLLRKGHAEVKLSDEELRCLATWMDANALCYGTFDPEDQKRQLRGERIAGPALE